ncbi:MAG: glucose-6-phosphate isomerase [Candidatus Sericytochromatia bacterium]|nr:MAG: glucose-6-phosphate isomerase [Candidatus Sericytochromatia bacterium]
MKIKLDYNYLMSDFIGQEGISKSEIEKSIEKLKIASDNFWNRKGKGNDFLGFIDLPDYNKNELDNIIKVASEFSNKIDSLIILGIGGSYLGTKAIFDALKPNYYNELSKEKRKYPKVYFEGNNLDANSINNLFELIEEKKEKFGIVVISKSGTTIETAVAFRLFQQKAKEFYGSNYNEYIIAITDKSKGKLKEIADKDGYKTFVIPDNVGGRYSVLTPVGLLPSAMFGINIEELLKGAKFMKEICSSSNVYENPAYMYALLQYLMYKKRKNISIMAMWSKSIESLGFWYDQLCAESLGKEEKGRIPITVVNTRDLHSRGQQIQEGQRNMIVTNVFIERLRKDIIFPNDKENIDGLNYLQGKCIHDMLKGAFEGTNFAYLKEKRPTIDIILPRLNEFTIGQFFYMLEVSTVIEGYLLDINPLDQPGVEAYKKFMFANLGREDMKNFKKEFDNRIPKKEDYII